MKIKLLIFAMLIGLSASAQFTNFNSYGAQKANAGDSLRLVGSAVGSYLNLPTTKMLRAAIAGVTPVTYTNGYGMSLVGQQFRVDTSAIASKTFANTKVNKVQKIIYVDDFADTGTGINSAFRKAYNSVDSNAILIFSAKRYKFPDFTTTDYISKPGITLQGSGMGYNSENGRRLNGGTIIDGGVYIYADNFLLKDLGFDGGKDWSDASGNVDGQVLIFLQPNSTAPLRQMKNVRVENVYCLGTSGSATGHVALFENINGLYVNNLWASYGSHGIVFKSENVFATNLHSYAHNGDNVLVKSDDYARANNIYISNIFVSKYIPNTPSQWDIPIMNDGVSIKAIGADLANITVENASIEWANFAFTVAGDPGRNVSSVYANNIITNTSLYGMSLIGGAGFDNIRFGDVSISNSTQYGVVNSTSNAANHTTIQNLKIYNAAVQGIGVLLVGNSDMRIENIEGNNNSSRYSVATGTMLKIGNEYGAGNASVFASGSNTDALTYLYPSVTGDRASGNWPISITGNSATSNHSTDSDKWSNQPADFTQRATGISSILAFNNTSGLANYALSSDVATWIGLPAYQTLANLQPSLTASSTKYPSVDAVNTGLSTKANLAGGNTFSGLQNFSGNANFSSTNITSFNSAPQMKAGIDVYNTNSALTQINPDNSLSGSTPTVSLTLPTVTGKIAIQSEIASAVAIKANINGNSTTGTMLLGTTNLQDVNIIRNSVQMIQVTNTVTMPFGLQALVNNGGANDVVRNVDSGKKQVLSASGNGSSTTISIPHGMAGITTGSWVSAIANNAASAGIQYVTVDSNNVNIIYTVAPVTGTNNLTYSIEIKQ